MNLGLKEQWVQLVQMDTKAQEVNKELQGCLESVVHQDRQEKEENQASQDPKDLQDFLGPQAEQGLKVIQALQARLLLQREHQQSLFQGLQDHQDPWDPQVHLAFQDLLAQLVSQDSKVPEGREAFQGNQ